MTRAVIQMAAVGLASFVSVAVAVHLILLQAAPNWATDRQIEEGLKRGGQMNALIYGKPPRAGATSVPLANPDTLATRAYLDLSRGPLIIEGLRPENCSYWSASVFAHNTDAVLVKSDRDLPEGKIAIGLRLADQALHEPVNTEAVLPSKTGVLLIRCFMRDRTDKSYVDKLSREIRGLTMRPAQGTPS